MDEQLEYTGFVMPMTIYLDEAGHTGENLLDPDQKFFVLSTICVSEPRARELKAEFFSDVQAPELKFKTLKKSDEHLDSVALFIHHLTEEEESPQATVRSYFFDKRYALLLKAIDYLIEPGLHEAGINLYEDGGHIALAHVFWVTLHVTGGEDLYVRFLQPFQAAFRNRNIRDLYPMIAMAKRLSKKSDIFQYFAHAARRKVQIKRLLDDLPPGALDLALTGTLRIMQAWRESIGPDEKLELVHDESSNMARQLDRWEFLVSADRDPFRARAPAGEISYPVDVSNTELVSSKSRIGVQLADVMAGALVEYKKSYAREAPQASITQAITRIVEAKTVIHLIPSAEVDPEKLGLAGTDQNASLNYLTWQHLKKE